MNLFEEDYQDGETTNKTNMAAFYTPYKETLADDTTRECFDAPSDFVSI